MASVLLIPARYSVLLLAALLLLLAALLLLPSILPTASGDARFSISTKAEGRRLLVIGNNSLNHDLICDYSVSLRMGKLNPEDQSAANVRQLNTPHGPISVGTSDENLSSIGRLGARLPKGSLGYVLEKQEFRVEIVRADLTSYGCRLKETFAGFEKDQSQPPFDKR
jgi:hypothetical protein